MKKPLLKKPTKNKESLGAGVVIEQITEKYQPLRIEILKYMY